jgi:ketosteroid isomerase-like protein
MQRSLLALSVLLLALACHTPAAGDKTGGEESLRHADIAFSSLSKEKGMRLAFLAYADSAAVLLRQHHYPIVGPETVKYIERMKDSGITLTWKPTFVTVAASGELGYTYGIYTFTTADTSARGTYVTIWKKDAAGGWKYVLDSGNEGLGK